MSKYSVSQADIIIVLIATLFTITVNLPFLTLDLTVKNIFSVLLLFIPGYAVLISIFPANNSGLIKKILYSFLINVGILILIVILNNTIFTSFPVTESNLSMSLSILTIVFAVFAYIRRKRNLNTEKIQIACQRCGGYYELQEGESLEDFERCQCGGKLYYIPYNVKKSTKKSLKTPEKVKKRKVSDYSLVDMSLAIFITILSILSVSVPQLNESIVRMASVFILMFFLSGYALTTALFPLERKLSKIKRFLLSIVFSIAIILLMSFGFSFNPFIVPSSTGVLILSIITVSLIMISVIKMFKSSNNGLNEFFAVPDEEYEFKTLTGKKLEEKSISKSQYLPVDLILILLTAVSCLIFEFTVQDKSFIEIIFALLFVLFLPGYSLMAAVFPKQNDLEKTERMALSFGLSVLIAPIIGLLLNYTSYGINLTPLVILLAIFTILMEIPAYILRQRVPEDDRFIIKFRHYSNEMTEDDGVKDR